MQALTSALVQIWCRVWQLSPVLVSHDLVSHYVTHSILFSVWCLPVCVARSVLVS